ncbi:MAG TPA: DUF4203 domain-containing protein [Candidatus Limnocylindrales bacterium]|nr:DUF4203 domain-containing protein [Candidatus Limnocylindrales bacterium]
MSLSLEGFLLGIIALAVGAAFTFYGFKFFLILLPLWAFVAGFAAGAQAMSVLFGDGFLATVLGWVIGFVTGAAFAIISYLWYWAAVVLLGLSVGYQLGVGLMALVSVTGFFSIAIGIIVGVAFAIGTIVLGVPRALVVVLTALGGAATVVAGALLIIGQIQTSELGTGLVGAVIYDNPLWLLAFAVIAALGIIWQYRTPSAESLDSTQWRYA